MISFSFTVVGRYVTWPFKFSCHDTICELKRQLEDFDESSKSMALYIKLNYMSYYLPSCLDCVLPTHSLFCMYDAYLSSILFLFLACISVLVPWNIYSFTLLLLHLVSISEYWTEPSCLNWVSDDNMFHVEDKRKLRT